MPILQQNECLGNSTISAATIVKNDEEVRKGCSQIILTQNTGNIYSCSLDFDVKNHCAAARSVLKRIISMA